MRLYNTIWSNPEYSTHLFQFSQTHTLSEEVPADQVYGLTKIKIQVQSAAALASPGVLPSWLLPRGGARGASLPL